MAIQIIGSSGSVVADVHQASKGLQTLLVDPAGNSLVRADKTTAPATVYGIPVLGACNNVYRVVRTDRLGTVRTGNERLLFHDPLETSTVNTLLWTASTSTMTITQSNGTLNLNANSSLASGAYALETSTRQFMKFIRQPLIFVTRLKVVSNSNSVSQFGFGSPAGAASALSNGAAFRMSSSGQLIGVISTNNTEVTANLGSVGALDSTYYYNFLIAVEDDNVRFIVEDSSGIVAEAFVSIAQTTGPIWTSTHAPTFFQVYNSGAASGTAASLTVTSVEVQEIDLDANQPFSEQLASFHRYAAWDPTTFAQTPQLAAGAAPGAVTPTNTAASYTTLGGEYLLNATATSENLLSVFSYTVPSPYSLKVTGIYISVPMNTGAAVATTATLILWAAISNCASTNISTGGGSRVCLPGYHTAAVALAANSLYSGSPISMTFNAPLVTDPGKVFHIAFKVQLGTATASRTMRGQVLIDGYFE